MKLTPKVYETTNQKILDFVIGFLGWFLINGLLYGCALLGLSQFGADIEDSIIPVLLLVLPLLINIGALVLLAFTRRWIALGALAAFAVSLLIALVLGAFIWTVCFNSSSI